MRTEEKKIIEKYRVLLAKNLEVDEEFVLKLREKNVLSQDEEERLKAKNGTRLEQAKWILDHLLTINEDNVLHTFKDCLEQTNQKHLVKILEGKSEGDWKMKQKLQIHRPKIVRDIVLTALLLDFLEEDGVLTKVQRERIQTTNGTIAQAGLLLDMINRKDDNAFVTFKECLRKDEQTYLADLLDVQHDGVSEPENERKRRPLKRKAENMVPAKPHPADQRHDMRCIEPYHNCEKFLVCLIQDVKVTKTKNKFARQCVHCNKEFDRSATAPPSNIFFSHKEQWAYHGGKKSVKYTVKYICPDYKGCIMKRYNSFCNEDIEITPETKSRLGDAERKFLREEFNFVC